MARFNLFKQVKHQKFDYKPRFYDRDKEELEKRLKKYEALADPESGTVEDTKNRIQSGLRSRQSYAADQSYRRKAVVKSNIRLFMIIGILAIISFLFISSNKIDLLLSTFLK